MRAHEFSEDQFGTNPKRPARSGSRPPRGHEPQKRYVTDRKTGKQYDPDEEFDKLKNSDAFNGVMKRLSTKESLEEHKKGVKAVKYSKKPKSAVNPSDAFAKSKEKAAAPKPAKKNPLAKVDKHLGESKPGYLGVAPDTKCNSCGTPYAKHFRFDAAGNIESTTVRGMCGSPAHFKSGGISEGEVCENCGCVHELELDERGKASLKLCKSSTPDEDLGASNLASCKSQGLRARDGDKSHKLGKSSKSRVKVGGHKIKGKKYGGPLPDWS